MTLHWELAIAGGGFIALASFLRGLTGFGFAIVATPLLALVLPPALAVPIVIALQIPAGIQTGMADWANTDRKAALVSCLAGVPAILPGLYVVSTVPSEIMRMIVGCVVVLSAVALSFGLRLDRGPRTYELMGAGALSGFLMGAAGMAGPPVIMLVLASNWTAARSRATLSLVFFLLGCASFLLGWWRGVVTGESIFLTALYTPGLFAGQAFGSRLFVKLDRRRYQSISLSTVAATGLLVIIRGAMNHI